MGSISNRHSADLAKENYDFLRKVDANADLRVDSSGKIYVHKIGGIFERIFGSKDSPDAKNLENTKINAEIWGHLIPEIKNFQAKTRLSEEDMGMIQSMFNEIESIREKHPAFKSRMKELLNKMDKRLEELACQYVKQNPEISPAPPNLSENPKQTEQVLEEIAKVKELIKEEKQHSQNHPIAVTFDQTKVLSEIEKVQRLVQDRTPQNIPYGSLAHSLREADTVTLETNDEPGLINSAASTVGNGVYIGVGLGAGITVGALYAVKQVVMAPYYAGKTVLGTLLSPTLVQNCLGITNLSNAIDELLKTKVWVPARKDGQTNVAYTGDEFARVIIPGFQSIVGDRSEIEMLQARWNGELPNYPLRVNVDIPQQEVIQSLEHIDWENNPYYKRVWHAGRECIIGLVKLGFTISTATMITLYLLGWYGKEHNLCNECNLDEPSISASFWDSITQWYYTRANWNVCDSLDPQKQLDDLQSNFQKSWNRHECTQFLNEKDQVQEHCNKLEADGQTLIETVRDENFKTLQKCEEIINGSNLCNDFQIAQDQQRSNLKQNIDNTLSQIGCNRIDFCDSLKVEHEKKLQALAIHLAKKREINYCDDEKPKPILENLLADLRKNPWKAPINFAESVDAAATAMAEKLSILKEPGKATLRKLRDIGLWLYQNPNDAFVGSEILALLGICGNAEFSARATSNPFKWIAWRGTQLAAVASICWITTINAQGYELGSRSYDRLTTLLD